MHTDTFKESQYLPILTTNVKGSTYSCWIVQSFAWGLNMLPFLPCQKTVKKDGIAVLDCWTKKYISCQGCLGHSNSKIDIRRGTGKTIKCFRAEWSLHIKSVKYFLPICNVSSDSIEKAPWFTSWELPLLFVAWDLFHNIAQNTLWPCLLENIFWNGV